MDIEIVPIMVNDDDRLSVHVAPTADAKKYGLTGFSHVGEPDKETILSRLPEGLVSTMDQDRFSVKTIPHPLKPETLIAVVSAPEDAFAPAAVSEKGRWATRDSLKFGPLPVGVKAAHPLQNLYTGSFTAPDLSAMFSGLMVAKSNDDTSLNTFLSTVDWERVAQKPEFLGKLMDAPKLDLSKGGFPAFKMSRRLFGRLALELGSAALHGFKSQKQAAIATATRASEAASALQKRASGSEMKPA